MAKELMEIGGFITEGAEIVNHDNTLSGNGTVDSPLGVNETVLWENQNGTMTKDIQWPQTLSEPITNFEKVSFLYGADDYSGNAEYHTFNTYNDFNYNLVAWRCDGPGNDYIYWREAKFNCNGTALSNPYNSTINISTAFAGGGFNTVGFNWLLKVVGINRKSGV